MADAIAQRLAQLRDELRVLRAAKLWASAAKVERQIKRLTNELRNA